MKTPIKQVAIVGGTHGNELTGIYLLKRWEQNPSEISRPSFSTSLFFANPKACEQNRRFIDHDLNRCFGRDTLVEVNSSSYEHARAAVLNSMIGPKGAPKVDLVIDLHTSTSNCGAMIILIDENPWNLRLAAFLQTRVPETRIYYIPPQLNQDADQPYLNSVCPRGLAVEVGPIPQGLLSYEIFSLSNEIVKHALDFAHTENDGETLNLPNEIKVFRFLDWVLFPGQFPSFDAIIHERLQGRDYMPLHPGDPIFRTLSGGVIKYEGSKIVYPVFINEAAYYYKGVAMSLTTLETMALQKP